MEPIDVWLKFENPEDEEAAYEANTFTEDDKYWVEWYHVDVGQVSSKSFRTYAAATAWLEKEGFRDFTS